MTIDLNDLEAGDTVRYGKNSKCVVNYIRKMDAFRFLVILFNKSNHTQTSYQYDNGGKNLHGGVDIVEIIKSHNWWTDEDMINAFNAASWNDISSPQLTTEQWLEQYKSNR